MIDSNGSISWGAPIILIILISHNWVFPRVRNICRLHAAALVLVSTHHNMTRPHQRRNLGPWPGQPGSGPDMIIKYSRFVQDLFPTKWSKLKPYCYRPNSFPIKTWRRYVTPDEVNFPLRLEKYCRCWWSWSRVSLRALLCQAKVLLRPVSICQTDQVSLAPFSALPSLMKIAQS